jgi:transcriptional regulator with XRE-family HTH domain
MATLLASMGMTMAEKSGTTLPEGGKELKEFGKQLKRLRGERSVPDIEKATRKAVSKNSLTHLESGRVTNPDASLLKVLAGAYSVDALELVWPLVREKYLQPLIGSDEERVAFLAAAFQPRKPENKLAMVAKHMLRAKSELLSLNVIDVEGVAALTKNLTDFKECWVVAGDFADDENPRLLTAIVKRMKEDQTKFVYFIPPTKTSDFKRLKYDLVAERLDKPQDVEKLVQGYTLGTATVPWILVDYSVFNPQNTPPDFGFQFRRKDGKPHLGWQLDQMTLLEITSTLAEWKRDHPEHEIKRKESANGNP